MAHFYVYSDRPCTDVDNYSIMKIGQSLMLHYFEIKNLFIKSTKIL